MLVPLVILLVATAAPSPSPTPLRTIINLRVSPVCSTLHNLVLPLVQAHQKNLQLLNSINGDETKYMKYYSSGFEGGRMLYAVQIDQAATNMLPNLQAMDELLKQSYASVPQGHNPQVDAMRQRVQNIVDVERAIANRYIAIFGPVVDSSGNSALGRPAVRPLPPQQPPSALHTGQTLSPSPTPEPYTAKDLKFTNFAQLQTTLRSEGEALVPQALAAVQECDGG